MASREVSAGVTGHRDLGSDQTVDWVRRELESVAASMSIVSGLTSLAVGADQLFAEVLLARCVPIEAVIPCSGYDLTFSEIELPKYRELYRLASRILVLPFPKPSDEAFLKAGETIVNRCDIIIAVWDGKRARGLGGTADIVDFAIENRKDVLHINPVAKSVETLRYSRNIIH